MAEDRERQREGDEVIEIYDRDTRNGGRWRDCTGNLVLDGVQRGEKITPAVGSAFVLIRAPGDQEWHVCPNGQFFEILHWDGGEWHGVPLKFQKDIPTFTDEVEAVTYVMMLNASVGGAAP